MCIVNIKLFWKETSYTWIIGIHQVDYLWSKSQANVYEVYENWVCLIFLMFYSTVTLLLEKVWENVMEGSWKSHWISFLDFCMNHALLCYFKLYVSFRSHRWIQAGVTVRKRPIWVKIDDFLSRVTLQFDLWPWKTIGHLFYATSSFVHHFVAIGDFKLELQSGNVQMGSNSTIFRAMWPWNLTDDLEKQ